MKRPVGRPRRYPDNGSRQRAYRARQAAWRARHGPKVYHTHQTTEWGTPASFYAQLHAEFGFTLDVCATAMNAKCARFYTAQEDGLQQVWTGVCWANPPYGRQLAAWMRKAYESAGDGTTVVCLVPARTDTRWWHHYAVRGEIRYVQGRLTFGGAANPAPFPNAVVIFRPRGG
jgi:phage N-6-adenine-methyltransferase